MDATAFVEERTTFTSDGLRLSGVLAYPASGEPKQAVLLCAPHPNFAGNMENNVILALGRHLAATSIVLRFDYRGVGDSEIVLPPDVSAFDYWNDAEEKLDYRAALHDVAAAAEALTACAGQGSFAIVGYSFGAVVGLQFGCGSVNVGALAGIAPPLTRCDLEFLSECRKPCLLLSGADDFVYSAEKSAGLQARCGSSVEHVLLKGHDHFFRGDEAAVCERVGAFLNRAVAV
jgi:hypothetical protein